MKSIIILMSLTAIQSFGSIRIVRGGGLAEMQLISIHQNLNQHIRICTVRQNPCGLSSVVLQEYQKLYQSHETVVQTINLSFIPKFESARQIYTRSQSGITLSSQSLYTAQGQALELKNLLALMVAIRLDLQGSQFKIGENLQIANQVWQKMQQQHQFHRSNAASQFLTIHTYQFSFMNQANQTIYIEDAKRTYDLTEYVMSQLPCGNLIQWRFSHWQSQRQGNQVYFFSQAKASCAEGQPNLIIKVELDSNGLIEGRLIRTQFRY